MVDSSFFTDGPGNTGIEVAPAAPAAFYADPAAAASSAGQAAASAVAAATSASAAAASAASAAAVTIGKADINSPAFTGLPTAPNPSNGDSSARIATTAWVQANAVGSAPATAAPLMDGTAAIGASSKYSREDHVHPTDTSRASVAYVNAQVATMAPVAYVDAQDAAKADKVYVDAQDGAINTAVALKASLTYVDAQDATKAGINDVAGGQCKFVGVNATTCKLIPFNGNKIKINGVLYSIPAAGVSFVNTGLPASTLVYAYVNVVAGAVSSGWFTTGHVTDTTAGNIGVEIKSGDPTWTLVGMVYTNASSQFVDTAQNRQVRSWFNDYGITFSSFSDAGGTTMTGGAFAELDATIRCLHLLWNSEHVLYSLSASVTNSTAGFTSYLGRYYDGTIPGEFTFSTTPASSQYTGLSINGSASPGEGLHTASMSGAVGGGTGSWRARCISGVSVRR